MERIVAPRCPRRAVTGWLRDARAFVAELPRIVLDRLLATHRRRGGLA